jgi:bacterioferritin-associated ferredoxin
MYVCICNALSDKTLAAASGEARSVAEVFRRCGKRPQCGKCLPEVAEMIDAQREPQEAMALAAE